MALPQSGNSISLYQVNVELSNPGNTQISMNQASVRTLFQVASGAIAMSNGFGKSSAVAASVSSYTSSPSYRCFNQGFDDYIDWYINAGTGTITVTLQRAAYNTCSWSDVAGLGTTTSGNWISVRALNYHLSTNTAFRLKMVNSVGTTYSPSIGVVYNWCDQFDYCSTTTNCVDNNTWGCNNCSQNCNCPACWYDCNCDCSQGYGTGGCGCDSGACDWCANPQNYECTGCCSGCCDENNENCTCDCSCDCSWVTNGSYPCPCSQSTCETYCSCPCGESCGTGERYTCQEHSNTNYVWTSSWSAC